MSRLRMIEERRRTLQLEIAATNLQWVAQRSQLRGDVMTSIVSAVAHRLVSGRSRLMTLVSLAMAAIGAFAKR